MDIYKILQVTKRNIENFHPEKNIVNLGMTDVDNEFLW
jgi:hypothetical protein